MDYTVLASLYDVYTFGMIMHIDRGALDCGSITTLFLSGEQFISYPSFHRNLHFKVIHNLIGDDHNNYNGLSADRWIE